MPTGSATAARHERARAVPVADRPPRVGLSSYREHVTWGVWSERADLLPTTYADAVRRSGGVPLLLPPVETPEQAVIEAVLDGLDGLILTGGPDVAPERYGAEPDQATHPAEAGREDWEALLTRAAVARDLPLLGICRGAQVMAVALGGTLVQHLPDVVGTDVHSPTVGVHGRHEVSLVPGSRVGAIHGPSAVVATYHHQAVDRLPPGFTVTGSADDGTVEAIESDGESWTVGVQWHPEVHQGEDLFSAFVAECRRVRAHRDAAVGVRA